MTISFIVSLTFFGLDHYFKAYSFILLFADEKRKALLYDVPALLSRNSDATVHFIVEASWPLLHQSNSNGNISRRDDMLQALDQIHSKLLHGKWSKIVRSRKWMVTDRTWSVPSYDLVWGAGHSYGGATVIVDAEYEEVLTEKTLETFKHHLDGRKGTGACSDCVLVFHRIGEKLKSKISRVSNPQDDGKSSSSIPHTESFNPFRQNGTLWVEMDCGHFYPHRDSWPSCKSFIDDSQRYFDKHVPIAHKSHYPNVPNLVTEDWRRQYYGEEGYKILQGVKDVWDTDNFFHHSQSISPSASTTSSHGDLGPKDLRKSHGFDGLVNSNDTYLRDNCVAMYDKSAYMDPRNRFDVTRPFSKMMKYFRARQ